MATEALQLRGLKGNAWRWPAGRLEERKERPAWGRRATRLVRLAGRLLPGSRQVRPWAERAQLWNGHGRFDPVLHREFALSNLVSSCLAPDASACCAGGHQGKGAPPGEPVGTMLSPPRKPGFASEAGQSRNGRKALPHRSGPDVRFGPDGPSRRPFRVALKGRLGDGLAGSPPARQIRIKQAGEAGARAGISQKCK